MSDQPELQPGEDDDDVLRKRRAVERALEGVHVPDGDRLEAAPQPVWFGSIDQAAVRRVHGYLAKTRHWDTKDEDIAWEVDHAEYGPATQAAVEAFQRQVNLPPSGVVDDSTWLSFRAI